MIEEAEGSGIFRDNRLFEILGQKLHCKGSGIEPVMIQENNSKRSFCREGRRRLILFVVVRGSSLFRLLFSEKLKAFLNYKPRGKTARFYFVHL